MTDGLFRSLMDETFLPKVKRLLQYLPDGNNSQVNASVIFEWVGWLLRARDVPSWIATLISDAAPPHFRHPIPESSPADVGF